MFRYAKKLRNVLLFSAIINIILSDAKEFTNLMKSRLHAVGGLIPTSKDVILNEIYRRTSQDGCLKDLKFSVSEDFTTSMNLSSSEHMVSVAYIEYDFSDSFDCPASRYLTVESLAVNEKYLWMFVPFVYANDTGPHLFSYACFTDSDKELFLPFVGDNIYRVDSIELNEQVLTLRNGSDRMVIDMTYDRDCEPDINARSTMWHNVRESSIFSLSGTFNREICDSLDPGFDFCEIAKENSCEIYRAGEDFCFRLDNVGPSKRCDAQMEITELTGIFREKSLLTSETPLSAKEGNWIRGNRSLTMITPCFK